MLCWVVVVPVEPVSLIQPWVLPIAEESAETWSAEPAVTLVTALTVRPGRML